MKGLKDFLPLLLLAVATMAIPLPEPRSIAMVSAHDAAVERDGVEDGAFNKREIRGDLDAAEQMESVTEVAVETEEPGESESATEMEKGEEGMEEVEEAPEEVEEAPEEVEEAPEEVETDGATTTEGPWDAQDGGATEEEMKSVEEDPEEMPAEEEDKAQEEQATTEEAKSDKPEESAGEKKVAEEEKVDSRIGEVDKHDSGEGMPTAGQEEDGMPRPIFPPEGGPVFALPIDHPSQGPFPWPWSPLPLDLPVNGFPDHPVQQVGNEVQPQPKVIFPIYFIRIDHRFLPESPYQGL